MPFPQAAVDDLLAKCHRRCCVCHRFCGIKIETDHIVQKGKGGRDTINNAIALCFECHAEVHLYNDKHPRGRKYHPNELKRHKKQWLQTCKRFPHMLSEPLGQTDGGPLSGMLTELEFNLLLMRTSMLGTSVWSGTSMWGCPFEIYQFQRAVSDGILSLLDDSLREMIMHTYADIKNVNHQLEITSRLHPSDREASYRQITTMSLTINLLESIQQTIQKLCDFLAQK